MGDTGINHRGDTASNTGKRILLVDDDETLLSLLSEYLEQEGFVLHSVHNGQAAVDLVQQDDQFDVIVLDIMMPMLNGLEVLQILRQRINTPILMLTGRGDDIDRIIGLEMGADDYLGKPCNPRELLARIRAILRRSQKQELLSGSDKLLSLRGISLDIARRETRFDDKKIDLTGAEFNVLTILMQSAGKAISKEELTRQVLHREITAYDRSIDVHVSRLRKKIEAATGKADDNAVNDIDYIKTIRGAGYQFIQ